MMSRPTARPFGRLAALASLCTALLAHDAAAQHVIDQQHTPTIANTGLVVGALTRWFAQTFTPSASNVSGAGLYASNITLAAPLAIQLWNGDPGVAGSGQLASAATTIHPVPGGGWFDVFWSPVAITPGSTYWLVFGVTPANGVDMVFYYKAAGDPYPGGSLHSDVPLASSNSGPFPDVPDEDLAFREYAAIATAPEPATWALFGSGMLIVGAIARRRRVV